MSEYQAIFDAVNFANMGFHAEMARYAVVECATRPHVLMRPAVFPDGNMWCALYGEDLQSGVAGFGETPADAMADFDKNWCFQKLSIKEAV